MGAWQLGKRTWPSADNGTVSAFYAQIDFAPLGDYCNVFPRDDTSHGSHDSGGASPSPRPGLYTPGGGKLHRKTPCSRKNVGSATTHRIGNYAADRQLQSLIGNYRNRIGHYRCWISNYVCERIGNYTVGSATTCRRIGNYDGVGWAITMTRISNYMVPRIGNYVKVRISN